MADINRKPISTQISEKLTPDHQKTMGKRIKESVTGGIDHIKAVLTPNSKKSVTQQATDKVRGTGH
jgi:hypothetical protein